MDGLIVLGQDQVSTDPDELALELALATLSYGVAHTLRHEASIIERG